MSLRSQGKALIVGLFSTTRPDRLVIWLTGLSLLALVDPVEAKVIKWSCRYPIVANPNGVVRDQTFELTFTVDDATGKATSQGSGGIAEVSLIAGAGSLTFVERLASGTVQTTTLDAAGHSVHSRHVMLNGFLVPSQSYGTCVSQ